MRILGRGKTALSIKEIYPSALMYDDSNKSEYDIESDELTVVSPGIPPYNSLVKNTKNLISEYDLFFKEIPFSVWISGTNGKTTTTQMLQHLLKDENSQCGGNIGYPLALMDKTKKIWILETSSFTLHYTNIAKPNIYILLPVHDDHLSWHGSFKEYEKAKLKPLELMDGNDIAIIPSKFKEYKTKAKCIYYNNTKDLEKKFNIDTHKVNFKEPFLMDALLALIVSQIITKSISYERINTFIQDPHKLEEFKDARDRIWVDDSKATNVDATIQALKTYKDKTIFLILGGDDKGANLIPLFEELKNYNTRLYLIGKNSSTFENLSMKYGIDTKKVNTLNKAVNEINNDYIEINTSVAILSPAAASLDQFSSYKERGEKYKEFVNSLLN
jgi:UDP-N-acetylmuramoylalanine--D-glutamate ligase